MIGGKKRGPGGFSLFGKAKAPYRVMMTWTPEQGGFVCRKCKAVDTTPQRTPKELKRPCAVCSKIAAG